MPPGISYQTLQICPNPTKPLGPKGFLGRVKNFSYFGLQTLL